MCYTVYLKRSNTVLWSPKSEVCHCKGMPSKTADRQRQYRKPQLPQSREQLMVEYPGPGDTSATKHQYQRLRGISWKRGRKIIRAGGSTSHTVVSPRNDREPTLMIPEQCVS